MNADTHLELEDLIAEVTGQPVDDRAREHLANCEHCRAETDRWNLVADGVCGLAAATPEVAQPVRRRHALADPRRRAVLAASTAAALVLLGGGAYGAVGALTGHAPGTVRPGTVRPGTKAAVLTAVSGCAGLEQASGTLGQVSGSSVVIETASGRPVTVTTTASTLMSVSGAPLSDITDGIPVMVLGTSSAGTIAADNVIVGVQKRILGPKGIGAAAGTTVQGTVSDASSAGFTVVTADGTRVPVTISSDTVVTVPHAGLAQLQAGATTIAFGYVGSDGSLSAIAVVQPSPKKKLISNGKLMVKGCSLASIDDTITTALVSGN
jgi:hypothetical protein